MYAVIQTGGKQYRVKEGDIITIEKLEKNPGDSISFDQVLMIGKGSDLKMGKPTLSGALVSAQVLDQTRGPKIIIFKKRRRHNSRRKNGHRQDLTLVKIFDISAAGGAKKTAPEYKQRPKKTAPVIAPTGKKAMKKAASGKTTAAKKPAAKKAAKKS
jgi:large subunit ribosomal protein L21